MKDSVYFETTIQADGAIVQKTITTPNGIECLVEEKWYVDESGLAQNITLSKVEEFQSDYYADLQIFSIYNLYGRKIKKFTRSCLSKIKFKVYEREYKRLKCKFPKFMTEKVFGIKMVLSPILKLRHMPVVLRTRNVGNEQQQQQQNEQQIQAEVIGTIWRGKRRKRRKDHLLEGLKSLSNNIKSLFESKTYADVILHCGELNIYAHRNVLCARSLRFCAIFNKITKNGNSVELPPSSIKKSSNYTLELVPSTRASASNDLEIPPRDVTDSKPKFVLNPRPNTETFCEIELDDVDAGVVKDFLKFIYCGVYKDYESLQETMNLYLPAYNYAVQDLKRKCVLSLESRLTNENVFDVLNLYSNIGCKDLQRMAVYHLGMNYDQVILGNSEEWTQFTANHPAIGEEIVNFFKAEMTSECSDEIISYIWLV